MKTWMFILLPLMVLASCHSNSKPTEIEVVPSTEGNRKAIKDEPPKQNNIPEVRKGGPICDTFKVKGGQDQIIAFERTQAVIDKIKDDKERLKAVRQNNDFQYYFLLLTKEYSGSGISINSTYACQVNIFDEYFATDKDGLGLILIKANGTKKVLPGIHTFDEWKDEVRHFFNK